MVVMSEEKSLNELSILVNALKEEKFKLNENLITKNATKNILSDRKISSVNPSGDETRQVRRLLPTPRKATKVSQSPVRTFLAPPKPTPHRKSSLKSSVRANSNGTSKTSILTFDDIAAISDES